MNYKEAEEKLVGRWARGRKLERNTYLERRDFFSIAIRLHGTDVLTFHEDGSIEVNTGGWNTVTTRDRINRYLPKPWHVYGERGATILSNYRWHAAGREMQHKGPIEVVLSNSAVINANGTVTGGESVAEYREEIRKADNETRRVQSRMKYWRQRAQGLKTAHSKLTVAGILAEENVSVRVSKMMVYGLERFLLEAHAKVISEEGGYQLLSLPLNHWRNLRALKMTCPSTQAVYLNMVSPEIDTVRAGLNWMYDAPEGMDYLRDVGQVA